MTCKLDHIPRGGEEETRGRTDRCAILGAFGTYFIYTEGFPLNLSPEQRFRNNYRYDLNALS